LRDPFTHGCGLSEVGTHGDRVGQKADDFVRLFALAPSDGYAHDDISLPGESRYERQPDAQQNYKRRDGAFLGCLTNAPGERLV
jgi:hypothetical protein